MKKFAMTVVLVTGYLVISGWGFFAHQRINRLAVFTLPPEMIGFYKQNITFISEAAVNPDKRRFSMPEEAPRHYIDLDHFGDSAHFTMPRFWNEAIKIYPEDTLKAYGIVPWHVQTMYYRLRDAFLMRDPERILKISAELGHYIGDAHVPLHTTENYNGQLTGQEGIHGFWESRLPELYSNKYNFLVGKSEYLESPAFAIWNAVVYAHQQVKFVLAEEKKLSEKFKERKYSFETKGRQTVKVYSREYAKAFHKILDGMVERQMKGAIKMIGDFWYTAWVDAGQPDLKLLINYKPSEEELLKRRQEVEEWKNQNIKSRDHEQDA
ncbi:MAG TPA: zinc dependent phospholipase C family protein [Chryseolinea sp.]|nr:zinc dependent phospholipase C family protein [Chryseolinea sp.]